MNPCNIMYKFGFPNILISLGRMCLKNTKYRVRMQKTPGTSVLKQCPYIFQSCAEEGSMNTTGKLR